MSLSNLIIRSDSVDYNNTTITLYGLNANDLAGLIIRCMPSLEQLFDMAEASGVKSAKDISKVDPAVFAKKMLVEMPDFVANVIAYAAHEPDSVDTARQLDAGTQMKAMTKIAKLTFEDVAGFREFVGNVRAALQNAKGAVPQLQDQSRVANASQNGG